jgi:glycosyltransferase domain-containing protein
MTSNEVLSKLTLVVPTYQRQKQALQTIKFWSGRGPNLIILDGSPKPLTDYGEFDSHDRLTYLHLPKSIQSRLTQSTGYIRTDYVTLMGDDEIHMPSSLAASISELEEHLELASCLGWAVGFKCEEQKKSTSKISGSLVYPGLHFLNNNHKNAKERLATHFGRYECSNIYAVVRTAAFKNAVKLIGAPGERVFAMLELEFELAILYQGGNRVLPNLHWLRNLADSVESSKDNDTKREKTFDEYFLDPVHSDWKRDFISTRSEILASIDGREVADVCVWVEEALALYSQNRTANVLPNGSITGRANDILKGILRRTITADKRLKMRKILMSVKPREPEVSLKAIVHELSLDGMNYSEMELDQVIAERFGRSLNPINLKASPILSPRL